MARHWLLMAAAGSGARLGADRPKQYLPLLGRTMLEHSLDRLLALPQVVGGVVVLANNDRYWPMLAYRGAKPLWLATGGEERCQSVLNGLLCLAEPASEEDWVLVHDAARPCVRSADLRHLLDTLADDPVGGLLAVPVCDTLKRADGSGRVLETVPRAGLWHAQTPQLFRYGLLRQALETCLKAGRQVTDESSALEAAGYAPRLVMGHADNFKVTRMEDLALAEFHLRHERSSCRG